MPIEDQELEEHYRSFLEGAGDEFGTRRLEKKQELPDLLTEENIQELEEGDIRELVRNLWAFEGWTNKDYIVDQILEDGIEHVRTTFHQALYETEDIGMKFDLLNDNVNMLGPASVTEILTFLYPSQCAIYNRRAGEGLQVLGYEVPSNLRSGDQYQEFNENVQQLQDKLSSVDTQGEINDLVDVDYFLFYLSKIDTGEEPEKPEKPEVEFDHEEFKQKLLAIGDGLGFDVTEEYEAGPRAVLDVRWSTRVANLGVISYAFEVHHKGSPDSALLNLMKAQNTDPTLQKLVIVSTEDQIEKFEDETDSISADLTQSITYFEASQVQKAETHLEDLKDVLQEAGLMGEL